ncbi:CBS domain-containing protein [Saccharothrix ecbatanensis]|uniref:CBS domain-containing protein n=1 Tax=Saccharothrix ecbatanensis TaxID=1105145 RepID=A0A7W9HFD1_9PSEU|nr:CBS domain-containing protein [Saccharothrix ecbatanensis]MBB5801165.1 CBS domain-containing protein [Saccharothrix ecbatanensis]
MRVRDLMTRDVVTVSPESPARDAAALLATKGFTALPVVDGAGTLVGVVTETDALRDRLPVDPRTLVHGEPSRARAVPRRTVADVMSEPVVAAAPGTDVAELARSMVRHGARSACVVDGKRLVGIVTRRDMLRAISRDDRTLAAEVLHRLSLYADAHRWTVSVVDGRVSIVDTVDDECDRHVAAVLAGAVPGVVDVRFPEARHAVDHG